MILEFDQGAKNQMPEPDEIFQDRYFLFYTVCNSPTHSCEFVHINGPLVRWHAIRKEAVRTLLAMFPIRNIIQEIFNCWLSYATSQPVSFDMEVVMIFVLQYVGLSQLYKILN